MVRTIHLKNAQGQQIRTVEVHFGGDTAEECEKAKRKFAEDCESWVQCAMVAVQSERTEDGKARFPDGRAAVLATEKQLKKILDGNFGSGIYDAFFSLGNPFALVSGRFYCTNVFDALNEVIIELTREIDK